MDEAGPSTKAESSDEDDPVVKEIPLIHSTKLESILHLVQFPLKTKSCQNENVIKKCLYKPENKELMLEMSINTESPNFDSGRAELIANEIDGDASSKNNKKPYFENEIVDKVFLKSVGCTKDSENYAIAAYNGREVHITSITDVYQLRPYFPYLDKGLKRKKDILNNAESDEEEAGPSTAKQVTVKYKQAEDPDQKKVRDANYQLLQAKREQETWTECNWYDEGSTVSDVEKLKLISDNLYDIGQAQNLGIEEYVKLLVPEDQEHKPLEPTLPSHILSLHALRGLPLLEQCRLLLKEAQIIQFQQIMLLLAGVEGVTADALLKNLQKVAVLVIGNWVVKSEILYPDNSFSATSGVPAELMCRARDYILYLFTKHQYVERKKVSSLLKIPSEEVKEIFAGISKLRTHNKGWELSLPPDHDFINRHSDLAQRQNLYWEHRYHQLSLFLNQPSRQRRKSKSTSESDGGGKTRLSSVSW
ncbi:DNA-directed RNA polymerase III subunit RPC5-like [Sitophilus oryzae]|uniref:DNA-directed RNA polymerase III subunit RPC5-like n=1 Tax=Sitophilus oryzae TaxID=7048 RepID=A0A6J2XEB4_SITOR|nr:DNA-directed RNA polymerase III subunit RPC5-like isoform X2 [Sitophilus oryzae]XP_030763784.1 DNA-directed RNA polymerase III subunit RPC5-like [Sitophilus oryzae]